MLPAARLVEAGMAPAGQVGGVATFQAVDPTRLVRALPELEEARSAVRVRPTEPVMHARRLRLQLAAPLARGAELRRPREQSCRPVPLARVGSAILIAGALLLAALRLWPAPVLAAVVAVALLAGAIGTGLKLAAMLASRPGATRADPTGDAATPVVTLLIALYREAAVLRPLLERIGHLDYPHDRLDVILVVEEDDRETAGALETVRIPEWLRILTIPSATLRTKPRALNYALPFARGTIIGVYDAEDEPDRDQIRSAVSAFAHAPPDIVCLQGALDIANDGQSWITRAFALDYAGWFRVVLPGLVRLGLVVPLGGTTLFLRRAALESIGGWDAHNVTEDADLGLWIARRGWRTAMLPTTTREEATASPGPWIRQRSRWLKGYAVTCAAHLRRPRQLHRDLGGWRLAGAAALMALPLLQVTLAPALWLLWIEVLRPGLLPLPGTLIAAGAAVGVASLSVDVAVAVTGACRSGAPGRALWTPLLLAYQPMATLAAWRAWVQLARAPHRWDKTTHGVTRGVTRGNTRWRARRQSRVAKLLAVLAASSFRRVTKAREMWSRSAA